MRPHKNMATPTQHVISTQAAAATKAPHPSSMHCTTQSTGAKRAQLPSVTFHRATIPWPLDQLLCTTVIWCPPQEFLAQPCWSMEPGISCCVCTLHSHDKKQSYRLSQQLNIYAQSTPRLGHQPMHRPCAVKILPSSHRSNSTSFQLGHCWF